MKYKRIRAAAEVTGYTQKAIRRKIEMGVWVEGVHFRRAPDNCILINMDAVEAWVEGSKSTVAKYA